MPVNFSWLWLRSWNTCRFNFSLIEICLCLLFFIHIIRYFPDTMFYF